MYVLLSFLEKLLLSCTKMFCTVLYISDIFFMKILGIEQPGDGGAQWDNSGVSGHWLLILLKLLKLLKNTNNITNIF